jgi:propionyl-CoA carboxylase alpha chain
MRCLIVNRGEIASRLNRTLKRMGFFTLGLASYFDRTLPYVSELDFVIYRPDLEPKKIFLDEDFLVDICKKFHVECVHPGYGFLSESATLAEKLAQQNILFIGPSARALRLLGSKIELKNLAKKLDVPVLETQSLHNLGQGTIRFPAILKSAEGGGGRGMRVVKNLEELNEALKLAQEEARVTKAGEVFLEPYLEKFKHLEFQVLVSQAGDITVLVERDCTIQRKFQKIIEETPCPVLAEALRAQMQEYCYRIADYLKEPSVFTFEFLVSDQGCFLSEVNPRLQVEHTITEEIYKIDLVEIQTSIALKHAAKFPDPNAYSGSAMQLRVYAEDPLDFTPQVGYLTELNFPHPPSRLELSYRAGNSLTIFYDCLIAKLVEQAQERSVVIDRLSEVLKKVVIKGVKSNVGLLISILQSQDFKSGTYDNNLVEAVLIRGINLVETPEDVEEMVRDLCHAKDQEISQFSSLPGLVVKVLVKNGEKVARGQEILQLESMKMIYSIKASREGILELVVSEGDAVEKNQLLFKIK